MFSWGCSWRPAIAWTQELITRRKTISNEFSNTLCQWALSLIPCWLKSLSWRSLLFQSQVETCCPAADSLCLENHPFANFQTKREAAAMNREAAMNFQTKTEARSSKILRGEVRFPKKRLPKKESKNTKRIFDVMCGDLVLFLPSSSDHKKKKMWCCGQQEKRNM